MPNFAVISGNTVSNVIIADSKEIAEQIVGSVIEYTEANPAAIGWTYDEATGVFAPPAVAE